MADPLQRPLEYELPVLVWALEEPNMQHLLSDQPVSAAALPSRAPCHLQCQNFPEPEQSAT